MARPVGRTLVDEGEDGHLTLRGASKILTLAFEPATGGGNWTMYEDDPGPERVLERGEFQINTDSQVALSDRRGVLDLEVAAEAFTAKIFDEE
jgi:polyisoprenoid-binding protein YceI